MESRFYLQSNSLSDAIPTELGGMIGMTFGFALSSNRLSNAIPTELGGLTGITQYFYLSSNRLCGSVPADVASIVSSASDSDVTTGNFVGPTQCAAVSGLVALYESPGGSSSNSWTSKTNWMTGDPCEAPTWYGLTCASSGNVSDVVELQLGTNGLAGSLPTELGEMTEMTSNMNLGQNSITGSIP